MLVKLTFNFDNCDFFAVLEVAISLPYPYSVYAYSTKFHKMNAAY